MTPSPGSCVERARGCQIDLFAGVLPTPSGLLATRLWSSLALRGRCQQQGGQELAEKQEAAASLSNNPCALEAGKGSAPSQSSPRGHGPHAHTRADEAGEGTATDVRLVLVPKLEHL